MLALVPCTVIGTHAGASVPSYTSLGQDTAADSNIALTLNINPTWRDYAKNYSGNYGWEFTS